MPIKGRNDMKLYGCAENREAFFGDNAGTNLESTKKGVTIFTVTP